MALIIHQPARMSLTKTVPAQEPVTLNEMKAHSNMEDAEDDALISGLIEAARQKIEAFTQRALITQTYVMKIDSFPSDQTSLIELLGGNVQSLTSIAYLDTADASQTWAGTEYDADLDHTPARVGLAYNKNWPDVLRWGLPITITYVAGYGDNPGDVPESLRVAIRMVAAELYENRELSIIGAPVGQVHLGAKSIAANYRVSYVN